MLSDYFLIFLCFQVFFELTKMNLDEVCFGL